MNLRFSPFRNRRSDEFDWDSVPVKPVPAELLPDVSLPSKARRVVTIVSPEQGEAYRLKTRLLAGGHRHVQVFFQPQSLLAMLEQGHRPDVILVDDFAVDDAGMTGAELARRLRLEYEYGGLIFSTSPDHAALNLEALAIHGFSGYLDEYLAR